MQMSNEKIEKQIDDTIVSICCGIQELMNHQDPYDTSNTPAFIEALSKLIIARKGRGFQGDDCKNDFPSQIDITNEITYDEARAYIQEYFQDISLGENNEITYDEARAYIQAHSQDISLEDKEKIEELIHFIQVTTQNGIGFAKGCLYRYSDLLNRYKWLYKLTEKLLLQYWT